ncbi:MAG TPA: BlaI/MecI/CopY family transcriptional regulator [Pyrinomonadaceae bacterium]
MPKRETPRPTDTELQILRVLWRRGPSTVREVHEALAATHPTVYTTVLKLMQIMAEKGLVSRNEEQRAHVYEARLAREETQAQLLGDLLDRAFEGSATSLVMQVLSSKRASAEELEQIRAVLDELEGGE